MPLNLGGGGGGGSTPPVPTPMRYIPLLEESEVIVVFSTVA